MKELKELEDQRAGLFVKRFHTARVDTQTVGHHSAGVAHLICFFHPNPSADLLKAAIYHDLAEVIGDIPAPTKWKYPEINSAFTNAEAEYNVNHEISVELTEEEADWLRLCDALELMLTAWEQYHAGNSFALPIFYKIREVVSETHSKRGWPVKVSLVISAMHNINRAPSHTTIEGSKNV